MNLTLHRNGTEHASPAARVFITDSSPMIYARLISLFSDVEGITIIGYGPSLRGSLRELRELAPDIVIVGSQRPRLHPATLTSLVREHTGRAIVILLTDHLPGPAELPEEFSGLLSFDKATELHRLVEVIRWMVRPPEQM